MIKQQPDGTYIDDVTGQPVDVGQGVMGAQGGNSAAPTIAKNMAPPPAPPPEAQPAAPAPAGPQTDTATPGTFALPPMAAAPAARTMETEGTSTTVSGMDRKSKAAIRDAAKKEDLVDAEAAKTAHAVGDVARGEAQDAAAVAGERQQQAEQHAAAQQQTIAQGEDAYKNAMSTYKSEFDRYKKMDIQNFYSGDQRRERQIWAALTIAGGGLAAATRQAAAMSIGQSPGQFDNHGADLVNKVIDDDYQRQKERIVKQKEAVGFAKEGVGTARADQLHALNMLELQTAAKEQVAANKLSTMLAARGVDKASIAENQTIQALARSSAERQARVAQTTADHIQSTVQKRLTEQTGGAAGANGGAGSPATALYGPGGQVVGYAPDKERAAKINEANAGARDAIGIIAKLRKNFEEHGNEVWLGTDAGKERTALRDSLALAVKKAGQNSDKDQDLLEGLVASDWDLRRANSTRLNALAERLGKTVDNNLDAVGQSGAQVGKVIRGEAVQDRAPLPQPNRQELSYLVTRAQQGDQAAAQALRNLGMMR